MEAKKEGQTTKQCEKNQGLSMFVTVSTVVEAMSGMWAYADIYQHTPKYTL